MKLITALFLVSTLLLASGVSAQSTTKKLWTNQRIKFSYPDGWRIQTRNLDSQKIVKAEVIQVFGPNHVLCNVTYYQAALKPQILADNFVKALQESLASRATGFTKTVHKDQLIGREAVGYKISYRLSNVEHKSVFLAVSDSKLTLTYFHQSSTHVDKALDGCQLVQTSLRLVAQKKAPPPKPTPPPEPAPKKKKKGKKKKKKKKRRR